MVPLYIFATTFLPTILAAILIFKSVGNDPGKKQKIKDIEDASKSAKEIALNFGWTSVSILAVVVFVLGTMFPDNLHDYLLRFQNLRDLVISQEQPLKPQLGGDTAAADYQASLPAKK